MFNTVYPVQYERLLLIGGFPTPNFHSNINISKWKALLLKLRRRCSLGAACIQQIVILLQLPTPHRTEFVTFNFLSGRNCALIAPGVWTALISNRCIIVNCSWTRPSQFAVNRRKISLHWPQLVQDSCPTNAEDGQRLWPYLNLVMIQSFLDPETCTSFMTVSV